MRCKQTFAFLLCWLFLAGPSAFAQQAELTKAQLSADLLHLKDQLLKFHPNVFIYNSPESVDQLFQSTIDQLPAQLTTQQAYRYVSGISAAIADGHSYVYPRKSELDKFYSQPIFPLDIQLSRGQAYVAADWSNEKQIPVGAKLKSINGIAMADILQTLLGHIVKEGDNQAYTRYLVADFFTAYFPFFYGFQEEFEIVFEQEGVKKTAVLQGLTGGQIKARKTGSADVDEALYNTGISTAFFPEHSLAILTIKTFDNTLLKYEYAQKFKLEIKYAFASIAEKGVDHLVIDLRGNQGGALSNGVLLLQQFMDKPFQCVDSYYKVSWDKKTKTRTLKETKSKWTREFTPLNTAFGGEVFLFCDGGSFSCSAIVARAFKESKRGLVFGSMTGGSAYVNSGGPNETLTLPNSSIVFTIPKTRYQLVEDLSVVGAGVNPDILIMEEAIPIGGDKDVYFEKLIPYLKPSK